MVQLVIIFKRETSKREISIQGLSIRVNGAQQQIPPSSPIAKLIGRMLSAGCIKEVHIEPLLDRLTTLSCLLCGKNGHQQCCPIPAQLKADPSTACHGLFQNKGTIIKTANANKRTLKVQEKFDSIQQRVERKHISLLNSINRRNLN